MKFFVATALLLPTLSSIAQPRWQQRVDTRIEVSLDDKRHMLHGFEEIMYINNSPDTLRFLYIHLWPNAYKNDHTPFAKQKDRNHSTDFYYSEKADRGYIDSLAFIINDSVSVDASSSAEAPDVARIELPRPLLPGKQVRIATSFRVKLPKVFSRSGHTGQAYYVAQWFPKPAVYDHKGWHPMSYLDQGEFYSEFGSYNVSVTVPANYVVMATGNCITESENRWLDSLAQAPLPPDTTYKSHFPPSASATKTITFTENNVHDFAWFADKRYVVRKDTAISPGTGKAITTWAAWLPAYNKQWKKANKHLKTAITHYGRWVGPYPYNTIKAVLGDMKAGGGMEYPTITLIDKVATARLEGVVIHEAGHNWFYGMLASNEHDHPWMDEGLNSFYEQKTTKAIGRDSTTRPNKNKLDEDLFYYQLAATGADQACNLPSDAFKSLNYGMDVYYKTAAGLRWLEEYMGATYFDAGMQDYFTTWRFHHPYPEDFKAIMQQHTTKDINWFFDGMLATDQRIDFALRKARITNDGTVVKVKNRSAIAAPVSVVALDGDSIIARAWTAPFTGTTTLTVPSTSWTRLAIADEIPDARTPNDDYKRHALFHKFGLSLRPAVGLNRSYNDKIFIAPALGQNAHDKLLVGLLFHNLSVPENRFSFAIAPMFSFGPSTWAGTGMLGYTWYPKSVFREINLQAEAKSFHGGSTKYNLTETLYSRYLKVAPSILFTFSEKDVRSPITRTLLLKQYNIFEDRIGYSSDSSAPAYLFSVQNTYVRVRYRHQNERTYNPFSYSIDAHGNDKFMKMSAEGILRVDYNKKNKAMYLRGFVGKYLAFEGNSVAPVADGRYLLNASYSGINDYLYDGTYRGRGVWDGFSGQQINAFGEGGFKVPVFNGAYRTDNWLAAVNLKTDLPRIGLPIRLFVDAGLMPNPSPGFKNIKSTLSLFDAGVEVYLSKDIVSFYFPLLMSKDFSNYLSNTYGSNNVFARSISFTLHLENVNWLRLPSRLLKSAAN